MNGRTLYHSPRRWAMLLTGVVIISVAGILLLRSTNAATFAVTTEAESGQTAGKLASSCDKSGASGSKTVKFGWATCAQEHKMFTNPVVWGLPDPGILLFEGRYYMIGTSGNPQFNILISDDLANWRFANRTVFNGTHPWGKDRFWAGELHRLANGRFAAYYSAHDGRTFHVGVATADNILGPYTDLGRPLVSDPAFGVIDANFFLDDDGRQYLYWKEDGGNTRIFAQELTSSGTSLTGSRTVVLQKGLAWEGAKGIEGTWVTKKNGQYYMFYSGELFSTDKYALGVARASSPMASFSKKGDPILRSGNRWKGPGHNSMTTMNGNDYLLYHAYDGVPGAKERDTLIDRVTWANGWPVVANGTPTEVPQPYPF